jgi:hypothetical protein
MSGTITNTITASYTLVVTPTAVDVGAVVTVASGPAVYGPAASAWSVINAGSVHADAGAGIALADGGSIDNQASAQI